jgi:hypothetical protein
MPTYPTQRTEGYALFQEWLASEIGQALRPLFGRQALLPIFDVCQPGGWCDENPSEHQTHAKVEGEIPDGAVLFTLPVDNLPGMAMEGDYAWDGQEVPMEKLKTALAPYRWWVVKRGHSPRYPWVVIAQPRELDLRPQVKASWGGFTALLPNEFGKCFSGFYRPTFKWS